MACTMPKAFGFHTWFEAKFGDLCKQHDAQYTTGYNRRLADAQLAGGIVFRGYPWFGFLAYIFVRLIGWTHYKKK